MNIIILINCICTVQLYYCHTSPGSATLSYHIISSIIEARALSYKVIVFCRHHPIVPLTFHQTHSSASSLQVLVIMVISHTKHNFQSFRQYHLICTIVLWKDWRPWPSLIVSLNWFSLSLPMHAGNESAWLAQCMYRRFYVY
jgi:hypothetical protein